MRTVFKNSDHEQSFRENGYVVIDLLDDNAIADLWSLYQASFATKRDVIPYAKELPYYISIFDCDIDHRRQVDETVSRHVRPTLEDFMIDYEVYYSNFMIKFPGDGEIEAHQDFNFVDESRYAAFNLWCPLVDVELSSGGLCVVPGSHSVFRTQRGPSLPRALTQYNDLLKRYARWIRVDKGQAVIFDHKLVHYSPPNSGDKVRVAVQSVLKPVEAPAVHYVFEPATGRVRANRIDREFILNNNLWDTNLDDLPLDHEQDLIPFPAAVDMQRELVSLRLRNARRDAEKGVRAVFASDSLQSDFERDGFVKLQLLDRAEVRRLAELFEEATGGAVENSDYGMYISLEELDLPLKRDVIRQVSDIVLPKADRHFLDCKPHLGSFLVKAPGAGGYTYPHQDWTFVDSPPYASMTIWIALVDTDESNGSLGFVRGSHLFFDKPVGSPSPEFRTCTQGHEAILYEYLVFVPMAAGEALVFDNRTIHGATANTTDTPRLAVAIGMTPREAQLYHYFLVPGDPAESRRAIAKLQVDEAFFERHTMASLKESYLSNRMPDDSVVAEILDDEFIAYSGDEIRQFCEQSGLIPNGLALQPVGTDDDGRTGRAAAPGVVRRMWNALQAMRT